MKTSTEEPLPSNNPKPILVKRDNSMNIEDFNLAIKYVKLICQDLAKRADSSEAPCNKLFLNIAKLDVTGAASDVDQKELIGSLVTADSFIHRRANSKDKTGFPINKLADGRNVLMVRVEELCELMIGIDKKQKIIRPHINNTENRYNDLISEIARVAIYEYLLQTKTTKMFTVDEESVKSLKQRVWGDIESRSLIVGKHTDKVSRERPQKSVSFGSDFLPNI